MKALHCPESRKYVFKDSGLDVMDARKAVRCRRTFIEDPWLTGRRLF
jgi:hypothetical protein